MMNPEKRRIYNSPRWKRVRRVVLKRDGWRCVECGHGGRLEVHHVHPLARSTADPFDPADLRTLCRACHFAAHGAVQSAQPRGLRALKALSLEDLP